MCGRFGSIFIKHVSEASMYCHASGHLKVGTYLIDPQNNAMAISVFILEHDLNTCAMWWRK